MPQKRSEGQTLVGCWCDQDFVKKIDDARDLLSKALKGTPISRSQFARDAFVEKCQALGIEVPEELRHAPDRTGKGGPKKKEISAEPPRVYFKSGSDPEQWNEMQEVLPQSQTVHLRKLHTPLAVLNIHGKCIWANQAFFSLFLYNFEEVLDNVLVDRLSGPATNPRNKAQITSAIANHQAAETDLVVYKKNTSALRVTFVLQPVENKAAAAVVAFVAPQTDASIAHNELREAATALKQNVIGGVSSSTASVARAASAKALALAAQDEQESSPSPSTDETSAHKRVPKHGTVSRSGSRSVPPKQAQGESKHEPSSEKKKH